MVDTPTFKDQVAHKVNVLASASWASDPSIIITGQLHNYPSTGDMVEEVISCFMHPGSHSNNRQIRPGQEDLQTLASMGVLDAARSIGSTDKFKTTARLGAVVVAILNRARQWSHGHDAVQQMLGGFWRQVDVYRPSADHYSRSSTVSKKFQALVPYLTVGPTQTRTSLQPRHRPVVMPI